MDRAWDGDVGSDISWVRGRRRWCGRRGHRRGRECGGAADVGGNAELARRNGRRVGVSVGRSGGAGMKGMGMLLRG